MKRIGQVARELGVCTRTLQRLEGRGVVVPKRDRNGQRRYTGEEIEKIKRFLLGKEA